LCEVIKNEEEVKVNLQTIEKLQFNQVKEDVATYTISELGKDACIALSPSLNKKQIEAWLKEVTEAKEILDYSDSVPIHGMKGMPSILQGLGKGIAFRPDQFTLLNDLLSCIDRLKRFMKDKSFLAPMISSYVYSLEDLGELTEEIARCIRNGQVDDNASKELSKIRKQIRILEDRIKNRMDQLMKSSKYRSVIQEDIVSMRNGRSYRLKKSIEKLSKALFWIHPLQVQLSISNRKKLAPFKMILRF
jgi:DNA mismatch repair protein MutS2